MQAPSYSFILEVLISSSRDGFATNLYQNQVAYAAIWSLELPAGLL